MARAESRVARFFPDVTVILGDPRLPDPTKVGHVYSAEDLEAVERVKAALAELDGYRFTWLNDHGTLIRDLVAAPPAFVLNLCDTGFRNIAADELYVPALLDMLGVPCSGAGAAGMVLCYDKGLVRAVAAVHGVPVPAEHFVEPGDEDGPLPLGFPALIKPCRADGSVGITRESVVADAAAARAYLKRLFAELPGRGALVQEFLSGPEYSVCLIGNPGHGFAVLPWLEVDYGGLDPDLPRILSYESKTVPDSPYWTQLRYRQAADLDEGSRQRLAAHARCLFERLDCRDYARFDFRADADGEIKLMEVNHNPAWCWDGKLNLMAGFAGMSYSALMGLILDAAQRRCAAVTRGRA